MMASNKQDKARYSVLIMGKTQAGKSTLVEHIKNYANPSYAIDRSLLGNGHLTKTESTRPFYINSNLPEYEVYRKETGQVINIKDLANQIEDEEDYREILFSREKDVGLRLAPHDPDEPSELVEFRFLDTPGLNDTNDRDISHAVNIISEMINTRSFNLIIIIIPYKNPLTQEQQLALEYYANVFRGLHTRIMFLHTHVDYADIHHTNKDHHLDMKMRNKDLSKMFRRYEFEGAFDEENVREYPSMTIDLVSKKRPVIGCLIRNTIREILKMATAPAVVLDTSGQNIDRIRAITHPSKFNDEERKRIKQRFAAEAAKLEKPVEEEEVDVGGTDLEQINILLIGDVRSGKTSLVETFRLYADTTYQAKTEDITQGNSRFADEKVKITAFLADLHIVQIRRLKASTGVFDPVDLEQEARTLSEGDFEDLLNLGPTAAETTINSSNGGKRYRFNIYEGPSLNESAENFEKNIFSVHRTLVESEQKFHQVLFTLAPGAITSAIRTTIRVCSDIFFDLSSLFSFVHTKIDYPKLHHGNKQFQDSMKERQELLQRYIQSSAAPYLIDCNLQSNWPVQRAKTYNVVHDILKTATAQTPLALKSPLMKKTPKMVSIDTILKRQAGDAFQDIQKEITQNNKDLLELQGKIRQLYIDYKAKDQVVNTAKNKEDVVTRDDMEIVFEDKFTAAAEAYPEIHSRTMTFKKQPRMVEKVHMVCENVEIEQALGGEGFNHWKIIYRRMSGAAASLVVKLYAKKQDSAGNPVGETSELATIRLQRLDLEKQLAAVEERVRSRLHIQEEYNLLCKWISRETLPKAVMEELTKAEVYEAKDTPFDKIKEIYLKSGGVNDTDPCEPAEDADMVTEVDEDGGMAWNCIICNERGCQRPECKAKADYSEESEHESDIEVHKPPKACSVLMFGKTQAGKSTFIEFVKNYANQRYNIDESLLGTGYKSQTRVPVEFVVKSNLPAYEVFDNSGERIDIGALGDKYQDPDDYLDALNNRKTTVQPIPHDPDTQSPLEVNITFLDTPGIEDTYGKDVVHAPKIIEAMAKMRYFNRIIVIINCEETPSVSHQLAFNYYSKVIHTFQGHHSNIVFLYTHVEYDRCHHSNTDHLAVMALRHKAFSQLFRCQGPYSREEVTKATVEPYPMYNIDFDKRQRPITRCMRLMTLREILTDVVKSRRVLLDTSTRNMEQIRAIIHPDDLNKAQRNKILETTRAILEGQQGSQDDNSDPPVLTANDDPGTQGDDRNSADDDASVDQAAREHYNCAEYFPDLASSDYADSEDEAESRPGADRLDSGISMGACEEKIASMCLNDKQELRKQTASSIHVRDHTE